MAEEVKKEAYVELDNNMKIETNINKPDVVFYDVRKAPFEIYGAYEPTTEPYFHRLPTEVGKATSAKVAGLEKESSGTRVRFSTDSAYIAIKVEFVKAGKNSHIPLADIITFGSGVSFILFESSTVTDRRRFENFSGSIPCSISLFVFSSKWEGSHLENI